MAHTGHVQVQRDKGGLQIHIQHELLGKANEKLVQECIQALLTCAATNRCLEGRFSLTEPCFTTVSKHNEQSKCLATCFGCA